jgi:hypothetical protein
MGVAFNSFDLNERFTIDNEVGGNATAFARVPTTNTNLNFRLDRNPTNSTITGYYSFDGTNWTPLGSTNVTLTNPRLMIWTGGSVTGYAPGLAVMDLRRLDIVAGATVPTVLSYSVLNPPAGLTISSNGVIGWTPSEAQGPSTNTVTTVVTDNGLPPASATNSFVVVVNEINIPPVLPAQSDRTLTGQQALLVTNTASDADIPANSLSYQLTGAPTGAAIDTNGVITWTPTVAQAPGTIVFTTVVTDFSPWAVNPQHLSATNSFRVVVNAIHNGPTLPTQTSRTIVELTTLTVTNTAIDTDLPGPTSLTYSLLAAPTNAVIDATGVIRWTPTTAQAPSTNVFVTTVKDDLVPPLSATNSFTVIVRQQGVPAPVMQPIVASNGTVTITWSASTGRSYRVQYKNTLPATNWLDLAPDVLANGPTASLTETNLAVPERFYRVQVLP